MNQNISYSNQISAEPELYFCLKCDWENHGALPACPKCGSLLYSQTNIRQRGGVMIALGFFMIIFMGALGAFVSKWLKDAADKPREWWEVDPAQVGNEEYKLTAVYVIFGCLVASGVTAVIAGMLQFHTGRRNMFLFRVFMFLFVAAFALGGLFQAFDR